MNRLESLLSTNVSRRTAGLVLGTGATALFLAGQFPNGEKERNERVTFSKEEIGININFRNFQNYGLDWYETLTKLLEFGGKHLRIPIPFDFVVGEEQTANFSLTDAILKKSIAAGKTIHIVSGIKTPAGKEVNAPAWYLERNPKVQEAGIVIGEDSKEWSPILEYTKQVAMHYLTSEEFAPHIGSWHIENEGDLKNIWVAQNRSVHPALWESETAIIQEYNRYRIPIVRNIPVDGHGNIDELLSGCDIAGVNVYPQAWTSHPMRKFFEDLYFWTRIQDAVERARLLGKEVYVLENQITYWFDSHGQPLYPFSQEQSIKDLQRVKGLNPRIVFLWDIERLIQRREHEYLDHLYSLVK